MTTRRSSLRCKAQAIDVVNTNYLRYLVARPKNVRTVMPLNVAILSQWLSSRSLLDRRRDSVTHSRREKIEHVVVRWRQHATETTPRWTPVGTLVCDLNGLVHRGSACGPLLSSKSGEDDLGMDMSVFAEKADVAAEVQKVKCDVAWRREDLIRFGILQPTKLIISR